MPADGTPESTEGGLSRDTGTIGVRTSRRVIFAVESISKGDAVGRCKAYADAGTVAMDFLCNVIVFTTVIQAYVQFQVQGPEGISVLNGVGSPVGATRKG